MEYNIVNEFIRAINAHDVEQISHLMDEEHQFIDAYGKEVSGKEKMLAGWKFYFEWFPDYQIELTDMFSNGDLIAAFGFASATFKGLKTEKNENHWRIPASWKIKLHKDKIRLWQVYADTKIPLDIIAGHK